MSDDANNMDMDMSDGEDVEGESTVSQPLIIPIRSGSHSDQFIEIFPEEIIDTPSSTLLQVLQEEDSDLSVYADAALHYIQHKSQSHSSSQILEVGCDRAVKGSGSVEDRARIHAASGISHLKEASESKSGGGLGGGGLSGIRSVDSDRVVELTQKAEERFILSSKIDGMYPMSLVGNAMFQLATGNIEVASNYFNSAVQKCGQVLPALLGLAAVAFSNSDYKRAQDLYAEAIRQHPTSSGAATRVGFGLTCYRLGQVDRAKAAFTRALDIDPGNVEAMVGSAVLILSGMDERSSNYSSLMEKAMKMISTANLLDQSNAMVKNHLANYYFFNWGAPLSGTVEVSKGSDIVKCSQQIQVEEGDRIRIGIEFETTVTEEINDENDQASGGMMIKVADAWKGPSNSGLKLWKKDFERVESLARGAQNSTSAPEIQAESCFILGRVSHVQNRMDDAMRHYKKACMLNRDFIPAKFGYAQMLIDERKYEEAAFLLKDVTSSLGTATDAIAARGLLDVKSGTGTRYQEGLTLLRKAVDLAPLDPELILLEALALQQRESNFPKALERYKKAIELMQMRKKKVSFEVYTNIGVLCHETRRLEESFESYEKALDALDEDGTRRLPTMENTGHAGGTVRHTDNSMFYGFLECGVKIKNPALQIHSEDDEGTKTLTIVESDRMHISELDIKVGDDILVGNEFETTVEKIETVGNDIVLSLKDPFQGEKTSVDDTVSDDKENKGSEDDTPEQSIEPELVVKVKRENSRLDDPKAVCIAFNLARLHETAGRIMPAIELHKAILKRNPAYVNSHLRLACIAIDCGALNECAAWLTIANKITANKNPEVLTLIGNLQLSLRDWKQADSTFRFLLQNYPQVESYSWLSMATLHFSNLDVSARYAKNLNYAGDYYKRILAKDRENAYAANGLGTCLAERGEIAKAKEVFNRVREVTGDSVPDAHLNLAHIHLAQKKHPEALQMYHSYLKKTSDSTAPINSKSRLSDKIDVLQYIAFANFDWALQLEQYNDIKSAAADEKYEEAMKNLQMALDICQSPSAAYSIQYNLCRTKLQAANCILQKRERHITRTAKEVEETLVNLEESLKTSQYLLEEKRSGKKVNVTTLALENYINLCKQNIDFAKHHLDDEKRHEETAEEIRRIQQEQAILKQQEDAMKAERKKEDKARQREELDLRAQQRMDRVKSLTENWQAQATADAEKKSKKGSKDPPKGDDATELVEEEEQPSTANLFDDSDDDDDEVDTANAPGGETNEDASPAEKPKDGAATAADLFGEDSDSDEDSDEELKPTAGSKRANKTGDDEDDDEEEERPAKKSKVDASDLFNDSDSD